MGNIVLFGCGKMGSAMLQGWLFDGFAIENIYVQDPYPSDWLKSLAKQGLHLNTPLPQNAEICIIAVKPQILKEALPALKEIAMGDTVFLSIVAGVSISVYENIFGETAKIIRAMPNTPAAIGQGMSALIGNTAVNERHMALCETLLLTIGETIRLNDEKQMDAVTAISGSGPAYVFYLIETMTQAGIAQGLPQNMALSLAKATVAGAGLLAKKASEDPAQLRVNVTSPGGTTQAALKILMDPQTGLSPLLSNAIEAAAQRSIALGKLNYE